ncbi:uncharacterized protein A4U43_C04F35660 [Asparagus officinalis]|uniref:DNA mismatch repair proteins mutS family domain-containing protein n=2 Tax=Asparagus officinalis TaxID=4686 RepID=A0A5P1F6S7_ASPOF|nr:uncharacterized protein A4U43_C04F35660 [Asparagus officinalis]
MVKSAIERVSRGLSVDGPEAMAVVGLMQRAQTLRATLETARKEGADCYTRFMPLAQSIMDAIISQALVKSIQQVIDDDGSVKDSASSELKRYRDQVRALDRKLLQLMDKLTREDKSQGSTMEVCSINGRWCMKTMGDRVTSFEGLLLTSGSGAASFMEPIVAVSLNDELQQARALVSKAEEDVLSKLSDKILGELSHIQNLLRIIIQLDIVGARAKYSIAYDGTIPELCLPGDMNINDGDFPVHKSFKRNSFSDLPQREWKLYMRKAYHPLLLRQHRESLNKARKDIAVATADIRRKKLQGNNPTTQDNIELRLSFLKNRVLELEKEPPVPVDFVVSTKTIVLVITGPNTGGKTISLKTVGLASLMAKAGLYVLASEPVKIPWFDAIFADIGDEQSLTQSLSTFSGHLKQISALRAQSTNKSLVLLDEVGAGTNPLEGAALGMSLLESFAEYGSFLTIATTHHGELKTLKYSNDAFENACVEFDERSLKPTYKILWGIPGRSNAINIAERLGLSNHILEKARKLHGTSGAEINEVIVDMETFKQDFQQHLREAEHYLMLSRKLHDDLLMAKQTISEHSVVQRNRKLKAVSETATVARSILRSKLQQFRESAIAQKSSQISKTGDSGPSSGSTKTLRSSDIVNKKIGSSSPLQLSNEKQNVIPEVGHTVFVPSLGKQARVLKVEASKGEITVQASNMKLRLKLSDVQGRTS